jgi:hypothetical protein
MAHTSSKGALRQHFAAPSVNSFLAAGGSY